MAKKQSKGYTHLIIGGGHAQDFPPIPPGGLTINTAPDDLPDIIGDLMHLPFRAASFQTIIGEYLPHTAFTQALHPVGATLARMLTSHGNLLVITGWEGNLHLLLKVIDDPSFTQRIIENRDGELRLLFRKGGKDRMPLTFVGRIPRELTPYAPISVFPPNLPPPGPLHLTKLQASDPKHRPTIIRWLARRLHEHCSTIDVEDPFIQTQLDRYLAPPCDDPHRPIIPILEEFVATLMDVAHRRDPCRQYRVPMKQHLAALGIQEIHADLRQYHIPISPTALIQINNLSKSSGVPTSQIVASAVSVYEVIRHFRDAGDVVYATTTTSHASKRHIRQTLPPRAPMAVTKKHLAGVACANVLVPRYDFDHIRSLSRRFDAPMEVIMEQAVDLLFAVNNLTDAHMRIVTARNNRNERTLFWKPHSVPIHNRHRPDGGITREQREFA